LLNRPVVDDPISNNVISIIPAKLVVEISVMYRKGQNLKAKASTLKAKAKAKASTLKVKAEASTLEAEAFKHTARA